MVKPTPGTIPVGLAGCISRGTLSPRGWRSIGLFFFDDADGAVAFEAGLAHAGQVGNISVQAEIFVEIVAGDFGATHFCRVRLAVPHEDPRDAFHEAREGVGVKRSPREKVMQEDEHRGNPQRREERGLPVDATAQDGTEDDNEHHVETSVATEEATVAAPHNDDAPDEDDERPETHLSPTEVRGIVVEAEEKVEGLHGGGDNDPAHRFSFRGTRRV